MTSPNPFSLRGKVILVTGASSGIGRQCAISFSRLGAQVLLNGRNTVRLKETMEAMDRKAEHQIYAADLLDEQRLEEILHEISSGSAKLDGVVNCAGISTTLPFRRVTPEKMNAYFRNNVAASVNLCRLVVQRKLMVEKGSSIVFLSSVMGMVGETGKALYGMTKGALIAATKSLAVELARKKIRVNCISPGVVESPMSVNAIYSRDEASMSQMEELHPLGTGRAEDVAYACSFLLSDAARWITGTNLVVDGGYTAR